MSDVREDAKPAAVQDQALVARLGRRAALVAAALALVTLVVPAAGPTVAAGVFGGALLSFVSLWAIKRGVTGMVDALTGGASARVGSAKALIMLVGRYALLALIAYVMIARLQMSPLGLLVGVSVIPIAAIIEALSALTKRA